MTTKVNIENNTGFEYKILQKSGSNLEEYLEFEIQSPSKQIVSVPTIELEGKKETTIELMVTVIDNGDNGERFFNYKIK